MGVSQTEENIRPGEQWLSLRKAVTPRMTAMQQVSRANITYRGAGNEALGRRTSVKSTIQEVQYHPPDWGNLMQDELLCANMPKPESIGVEDLEFIRVSRTRDQRCMSLLLSSRTGGECVDCGEADYTVIGL